MAAMSLHDVYTSESLRLDSAAGEIRMVVIESGLGDDIVCHLEKLQLPRPSTDDKGDRTCRLTAKYTALSYMWDYQPNSFLPRGLFSNLNQLKTIRCNEVSMAVTPNLYAALHQLRHATKPVTLWVDAICINQQDDNEKTGQVKLMGRIYSLAEKTLVWLGDETVLSSQGFKAVRFIATRMRRSNLPAGTATHEELDQPLGRWQSFVSPYVYLWHVGAFTFLLRNLYFTRIWIVQEIGLGQQLEIRGGSEYVSLNDFALATAAVVYSSIGSKNSLNLTNILAARSLVSGHPHRGLEDSSWVHAEAARQNMALGRDILSIMTIFRGSQATMKQDKIFGLLGLCREMEGSQTFGIEEDYTVSVSDAYLRAALCILDRRRDLDLFAALRLPPDDAEISELPSWVPDWSDTEQIPLPLSTASCGHAASRYSKFEYRTDNDPHSLYPRNLNLSGHFIDKIIELGSVCNTERAQASVWFSFKSIFTFAESHRLESLVHSWTQFGKESLHLQEFWHTATAGQALEYLTVSGDLMTRFRQRGFHNLSPLHKLAWAFIPIRASFLYFEPTLDQFTLLFSSA